MMPTEIEITKDETYTIANTEAELQRLRRELNDWIGHQLGGAHSRDLLWVALKSELRAFETYRATLLKD